MAAKHANFMILEMDQGIKSSHVDDSTDEEFYGSSPSPTSSPSEDIWKKFELFPTPPLSPTHSTCSSEDTPPSSPPPLIHYSGLPIPIKLQKVSECLLEEDSHWLSQPINYQLTVNTTQPSQNSSSCLKSNLIQDCMWSGLAAEERKKLLKKEAKTNSDSSPKKLSRSSSPPPLVPVSSEYSVTSDCVDPAAVFPYPLSETKLDIYSSGTCTPSDSEEEIDVVTVADKIIKVEPQSQFITTTTTLTTTKSHPTIQRHHLNRPRVITVVGSKRSRGTAAAVMTIPLKRLKTDANLEEVKRMLQSAIDKPRSFGSSKGSSKASSRSSSKCSSSASSRPCSHPSSDSEDCECDKRATHNVLERKRRDDLRCSFNALRDVVPGLLTKDRAAKVVILKNGTDFINSMRAEERRLLKEKENERRRHEELLKRLHALQRL